MIIVTGTKRSGTSMWMQLMQAAGVPVIGEAFSSVWRDTIYDANPHGFYESPLRRGVYYATNPDPKSGAFLHPDEVRHAAVKVFVPGLCRTDLAYVDRVVATVRDWREYGTSLRRLLSMEAEALARRDGKPRDEAPRLEPLLEWWLENYLLIRDVATRRYPIRLVSYARVVNEPNRWVPSMFAWLGTGDGARAAASVDPSVRTQFADAVAPEDADGTPLTDTQRAAFDLLYAAAHDGIALGPSELEALNKAHLELVDHIEKQLANVRLAEAKRRAARRAERAKTLRASSIDGPPGKQPSGDAADAAPAAVAQARERWDDSVDAIDRLVNPATDGD